MSKLNKCGSVNNRKCDTKIRMRIIIAKDTFSEIEWGTKAPENNIRNKETEFGSAT